MPALGASLLIQPLLQQPVEHSLAFLMPLELAFLLLLQLLLLEGPLGQVARLAAPQAEAQATEALHQGLPRGPAPLPAQPRHTRVIVLAVPTFAAESILSSVT